MISSASEGDLFKPLSPNHVGILYEWNARTQSTRVRNIFADEELVIGRNPKHCQFVVDDPLVSNKHLRIYTIIFDRENPAEVAPLVYAQDTSLNGVYWKGRKIGKGNGGFLLSDGDTLEITYEISFRFRGNRVIGNPFCETQTKEMEAKCFEKQYVITNRLLGSGAYGRVHMAIERQKNRQLACKIVDLTELKRKLSALESSKAQRSINPGSQVFKGIECAKRRNIAYRIESKLKMYDREVEILQKLRHPNIIGIEKVFKTENMMYIFQDLVTAGDLFSFLEFKNGKLLDVEVAVIVRQIVIALDYLHDQNIVHRDLKPDNVLMTSLVNGSRVILTDFGCARHITPEKSRMASIMGTLEYTAPEIGQGKVCSRKGYTKSVDLWSLGCVTVVLLTGGSPFSDPVTGKYSEALAKDCDLHVLEMDEDWINVGERAKDFVRQLLILNENDRLTAREACLHHWFTNPAHNTAFEEVYKRAVRGWKPRPQKDHVLYDLRPQFQPAKEPSLWLAKSPTLLGSPSQPTVQHQYLFKRSNGPLEQYDLADGSSLPPEGDIGTVCRNVSITLSDPDFQQSYQRDLLKKTLNDDQQLPGGNTSPKYTVVEMNTKGLVIDKTLHADPYGESEKLSINDIYYANVSRRTKSRVRIPFSPTAWNRDLDNLRQSELRERACLASAVNGVDTSRGVVKPKKFPGGKACTANQEAMLPPSLRSLSNIDLCPPVVPVQEGPPTSNVIYSSSTNGLKRSARDIFDFEEDEVFEEVEDPVSGKRRKIRYGEI